MITLGRLEEVENLRTVWQHEARDFTKWLAEDENIDILSDAVGIDISVDEVESAVGDFHADILASETGTDRKIIIENQLEDTNHDHLGKIITYAAGKDASIIIWLVKRAREEHKAAVEWLNAHTDDKIGVFLCEIKLYKIGDSSPAVKFEVVEKPNNWVKEARRSSDGMNETERRRYDYWRAFLDYAYSNSEFAAEFRRVNPCENHYLDFRIGHAAAHIAVNMVQRRNELEAELYIWDDKELFKRLEANKEAIEAASGLVFRWNELPDRRASRIIASIPAAFNDRNQWQRQFDWLINAVLKIKSSFRPYL